MSVDAAIRPVMNGVFGCDAACADFFFSQFAAQSGRWPCSGGRSVSEALLARASY
jgi:hypothetical protein